ncbi:LysR family transcriptional regulator ArgP [Mycolicibacterium confluentis]|uniref:HTH-type transcriptional regulator LysG n=1 Tax=Mycolicibacterium confluentis TaxID=28047 RepID=A0A7I7Y2E4_9MYCO|nr:LysR family transcriptional regulator ArgP [Mycolicibacterium confluentis]MCV7320692.1 LysR family transcriptional regulator ArgP [Mycolicibacterium confluentis]ORV30332.1 LysR family transcriptional regulator [Mycolicibacterium confluentis]BBZ35739.1 transcriptional regulator ArgP [Mycolicibacterium confluentis]
MARLDSGQLAALAAVIEHGSFEAAAAHLHVTPSAVSQRIKALEQRVGKVLVVREKPCAATPAGVPLLRLAAQSALLESEALSEMTGESQGLTRIALAVNADSMNTWFTEVFSALPDVLFDVRIEDQDLSAELLRAGVVLGAVTTERTPVTGCRVHRLGAMRYVPAASRDFIDRHLSDGFTAEAAARAPSLAWNRADALQDRLVRKVFRRDIARPVHYVPTAAGFGAAVHAGLGWGMFPVGLLDEGLVPIAAQHLDVPLYWQCWKLDSAAITALTDAVRAAAQALAR